MIDAINNISSLNATSQVYSNSYTRATSNFNSAISAISPITSITPSYGNSYNYYNQISKQDTALIKDMSNASYGLYSSATKLNKVTGSSTAKPEDIKTSAEDFVKKYNETLDTYGKNKDRNNTINRLYNSLVSAGEVNKSTLEDIGITIESNGKLAIDSTKFDAALTANADRVKDTLSDVGKKVQSKALNGMTTSSSDLLTQNNNNNPLGNISSDERYYESIRKMAGNRQFMNFYYSATAMFNMYI